MITYDMKEKRFIVKGLTFISDTDEWVIFWKDEYPPILIMDNRIISTNTKTLKGAFQSTKYLISLIYKCWKTTLQRPSRKALEKLNDAQ